MIPDARDGYKTAIYAHFPIASIQRIDIANFLHVYVEMYEQFCSRGHNPSRALEQITLITNDWLEKSSGLTLDQAEIEMLIHLGLMFKTRILRSATPESIIEAREAYKRWDLGEPTADDVLKAFSPKYRTSEQQAEIQQYLDENG